MHYMRNVEIFNESKKYMPGGVNSPVRSFREVTVTPPVIKKGYGAYLEDEEENKYIDFLGAWGPMLLGHCDEEVMEAVRATCENGLAFGSITELELKLAKHICTTVDNMEMIRMVNSGTEATMSAVKLARGFTGRDKIIKFAGCYHGHFEGFLVSAGSGVMTEGIPGCAGVPVDSIKNTLIANYNDIQSIIDVFKKYGEEIAAVIVEPIAGNMGVIPAKPEFLQKLSRLCKENGTVLIFDEVMSGFRVAYGGAQSLYKIAPDIITMGKIMGGGLPCGAYGGRADIMKMLSPLGPVYQAGTMSGNPMVMAAGLATLKKLHDNLAFYSHIEKMAQKLEIGVKEIGNLKGLPVVINRCESMMTIFFTKEDKIENYEDALKCDTKLYGRFFEHMLKGGIYMSPSQFEAMFFSVKHSENDIEKFLDIFRKM